jgi:hypothetical protein
VIKWRVEGVKYIFENCCSRIKATITPKRVELGVQLIFINIVINLNKKLNTINQQYIIKIKTRVF